eukprot:1403949-Amphidinium_carterae.1
MPKMWAWTGGLAIMFSVYVNICVHVGKFTFCPATSPQWLSYTDPLVKMSGVVKSCRVNHWCNCI